MSNAITRGISSIVAVATLIALGVFLYEDFGGGRGTDGGRGSTEKAQEVKATDEFILPKLDVEHSCQRDYPDQNQRNNCVGTEQSIYDILKGAWLDIPLDVRKLCVSRTMAKQSYYELSACVSENKPTEPTKFKY
jgi:hypothetical protein